MRGLRGVLSGALALIALQVLVSSGSRRVSGLFKQPGRWAKRFLDPSIPAIPDLRGRDEGGGGGAGGLAGGLRGRQQTAGGSTGTTRYPSPFERPAGLSATTGGGD